MSELGELLKDYKKEGTRDFPLYKLDDLKGGKIFAEASMGFLGHVDYYVSGNEITVKTSIKEPVLSALGMQLAGWSFGKAMISGPIRLIARKPKFIFDKLRLENPGLPPIACIEGPFESNILVKDLKMNGIQNAIILSIGENSKPQYINIPARACEIALFRILHLFDLNDFRIDKASSVCRSRLDFVGGTSSNLNDSLRYNSEVVLEGKFPKDKNLSPIVTKNTKYANKSFLKIVKDAGGIHKVDIEAFSVAGLSMVDADSCNITVIK
ncbi:MAG: hypothetical protein JXB14_06785 [Candidatus Altiarchaeota archaeon]|nr:hypothetical protein [Candidatus Altiarchaeota archaeon]